MISHYPRNITLTFLALSVDRHDSVVLDSHSHCPRSSMSYSTANMIGMLYPKTCIIEEAIIATPRANDNSHESHHTYMLDKGNVEMTHDMSSAQKTL